MEVDIHLPEIDLHIESDVVVAQTRHLRATWTLEAQQDLRAYHSFADEHRLVDRLAQEINEEIDHEIMADLQVAANNRPTDVGYFYAPYTPLLRTPVLLNPNEFDSRRGIITRYGRRLLEEGGRYYGYRRCDQVPDKVCWQKEGF